jgi:hypothetical protein
MIGMEVRRQLVCPKCHVYGWHMSVVGIEKEENICSSCEWLWMVEYSNPSKLYSQLVRTQAERIRDSVNSGLGRILDHKWGTNVGKKDMATIENVRRDLEHALRLIDTFTGD